MKNNRLNVGMQRWLLACAVLCAATAAEAAAVLPGGPADQLVDYGENVTFSVPVNERGAGLQWLKDGEPLRDYRNISGAQSPILTLIGVSHADAAGYSLVVSNVTGVVTSSVATLTVKSLVVFKDDFETGGLTNWTAFSSKGELSVSPLENHTPGGVNSALLNASLQKMYHNLGAELGGRVSATFWIHERRDGQGRAYGELRGYTGEGHRTYVPRGGLQQAFGIGRYDSKFGTNTGTLAGEVANLRKYQGWVLRGTNAGWFNLDAPGAPERSDGWHKFEIRRSADGHTVSFYVDGILGRTITGVAHIFLDCVAIGSVGSGTGVGAALFDDVRVEAYPRQFNWQGKDTAGKGLFDWMKVRETGTNAAVNEATQVRTALQTAGGSVSDRLGDWQTEGGAIYARDLRGYVEYVVTAPTDDAYRIEVEGREQNYRLPLVELPLVISVDGESLGRFQLGYGPKSNGVVRCFTPYLRAGPHTVRVYWDNDRTRCSLRVEAVRLQAVAGVDLNGNGFKDWVENRLFAQCGLDVAPAVSATSPAFIEGKGQYLSMMRLSAGLDKGVNQLLAVQPGPGNRWYANVPLSVTGPTAFEVSYQNGGLTETREIVWQETNLLEATNTVIRKGDALLLNALPAGVTEGGVRVVVAGVTNYESDVSLPVVHVFNEEGTFTVRGTFLPTGANGSIEVKVVGAKLEPAVATWVNKRRYWDCTNLPPAVVLDGDPRLKMARFPLPAALGEGARQISLINDEAEPRVVAARLGRNGPILASAVVEGFRLAGSGETYLRQLGTYPDGSELIEAAFIQSPVLPEVTVELRVLVSGVTFDDGTVTRVLTAKDFDSLGISRVRFVRAAGVKTSVCHATKVYQDGVLIGWPSNPQ